MEHDYTYIGRYRVLRLLGEGGMGRVYAAEDPAIGRQVAIKVLTGTVDRRRFLREARAVGRIKHPAVVTIYDVGDDHGRPFIAMEHIVGDPFDRILRHGTALTLEDRLRYVEELGAGLHAAHEKFVVHLDIKPSNLMLDESGRIRILDFGIARAMDSATTRSNPIAGSIGYMAPEQLAGLPLDRRTDIFAASTTAYEILTGRPAYTGGMATLARRMVDTSVASTMDVWPAIGRDLDRILERGLQVDPAKRFQSAQEFAEAFRTLRQPSNGSRSTVVLPTLTLGQSRTAHSVSTEIFASQPSTILMVDAEPARRRAWRPVAFSGVGLALLGGAWLALSPFRSIQAPIAAKPSGELIVTSANPQPLQRQSPNKPPNALRHRGAGAEDTGPSPPRSLSRENATSERVTDPAGGTTNSPDVTHAVVPSAPASTEPGTVADSSVAATGPGDGARVGVSQAAPSPGPGAVEDSADIDRKAITTILMNYASAYSTRSSAQVRAFFPSLSGDQLDALDRTFLEAADYTMTLANITVQIHGDNAAVACDVHKHIVPRIGGIRDLTDREVFKLRRSDSSWAIVDVR